MMLVYIEGYQANKLIYGKKCTAKQLKEKFKKAIRLADSDNFVPLFCRMFQFEEMPMEEDAQYDYVIELDTYLVNAPCREYDCNN